MIGVLTELVHLKDETGSLLPGINEGIQKCPFHI